MWCIVLMYIKFIMECIYRKRKCWGKNIKLNVTEYSIYHYKVYVCKSESNNFLACNIPSFVEHTE
jgi:hypothetical protein